MSEETLFVCVECGEIDPAFVVVCQKCSKKQTKQLQAEQKTLIHNLQEKELLLENATTLNKQLQAENEKCKRVIVDVHDLSYPGLAIKESTLLNKIYKLTMGYNTEQAPKGGEK